MIRGFYTALSGVVAAMTRQSVIADNIANVNTVGFKQSRSLQTDYELSVMNSVGPEIGLLGSGTVPAGLNLDISQGPLQTTGLQSDLAVEGDGLFVVRNGNGIAYSRAGDFQVDANGTLVTEQGYPVLDVTGHNIQVPPNTPFSVGKDGTIAQTGQRIALVGWPPGGATRLGENLYSAAGTLTPATGVIHQGMLEASNTDMALEMTELITQQRSFQMSARALSMQDGTLGDAAQLGRLR
jgi:flagellar basal body rod protein FlgG